ncbi:hypothetical protein [Mycobacterium sp. GA-2829]|uniref:hypothetical protein n=1 Tax=Mycobacterium sp. GA-2829 TaxID=1772283 RepID=UPI00073FB12D|nr:hypothetical protein [Mycobacterium sp. GA-2829]KUI30462.1 hypothetical protein AU194_01160 [Mycobacterium sp. GA-2829]
MTEPDNSSTRPISVAELLARNGTIGAPPVGGRRRRRRGNADAVTVAELTGEIPVITDKPRDETAETPVNGSVPEAVPEEVAEATLEEPVVEEVEDEPVEDVVVEEEPVEETAELGEESVDEDPADEEPADEGPEDFAGADQMSPDPLHDDYADDREATDLLEADADDARDEDDELPSYLRSSAGPLFGGGTVADDLARRGGADPVELEHELDEADDEDLLEDRDLEDEPDVDAEPAGRMSAFLRGAWIVGQCVIAVAFGAGLFIAFDQLWKWNNIVALVLSVLVILGLVVGVRVVRKTEDIGSTLIAVAVGALVTLGPLALLQSG